MKNEFEDNKQKSCSRFENRVPLKIDFRADWTHESIPTVWELNHSLIGIYKKYVKDLMNVFIFLMNVRRFYNEWGWHEQKVNFHKAC